MVRDAVDFRRRRSVARLAGYKDAEATMGRVAELAAHLATGFVLYVWFALYYVLGTGIDSL
jgi:hypothetical protein